MAELHIESMSTDDWLTVPDNPRQRDTERHWNRAKSRHLRESSETQRHVSMARTKSGSEWKLDGHTRSYAWERGHLPKPESLFVSVYIVKNEDEAKDLYEQFDAMDAVETTTDRLTGAFREHGFVPRSGYFRQKAGLKSALCYAEHISEGLVPAHTLRRPIYDTLGAWMPEIRILDELSPTVTHFNASTMGAALVILRKWPREGTLFFERFLAGEGDKTGKLRDGLQGAQEVALVRPNRNRSKEMLSIGGFIWCFEQWRRDETFTRVHFNMDYLDYLIKDSLRTAKPTSAKVRAMFPAISLKRRVEAKEKEPVSV